MPSVNEFLSRHHRDCDQLLADAEAAAGRDWDQAQSSFGRFRAELEAHMRAEEDILFPAFETATGMASGPTRVMRHEHELMRRLLEEMGSAAESRDAGVYRGRSDALMGLLQQHNSKEEHMLYPLADRAIRDMDAVLARIGAELDQAR